MSSTIPTLQCPSIHTLGVWWLHVWRADAQLQRRRPHQSSVYNTLRRLCCGAARLLACVRLGAIAGDANISRAHVSSSRLPPCPGTHARSAKTSDVGRGVYLRALLYRRAHARRYMVVCAHLYTLKPQPQAVFRHMVLHNACEISSTQNNGMVPAPF